MLPSVVGDASRGGDADQRVGGELRWKAGGVGRKKFERRVAGRLRPLVRSRRTLRRLRARVGADDDQHGTDEVAQASQEHDALF